MEKIEIFKIEPINLEDRVFKVTEINECFEVITENICVYGTIERGIYGMIDIMVTYMLDGRKYLINEYISNDSTEENIKEIIEHCIVELKQKHNERTNKTN